MASLTLKFKLCCFRWSTDRMSRLTLSCTILLHLSRLYNVLLFTFYCEFGHTIVKYIVPELTGPQQHWYRL